MSLALRALAVVAALAWPGRAAAEAAPPVAPLPGWVSPVEAPSRERVGGVSPADGVRYVLLDNQVALTGAEPVEFTRVAYDVVTRAGLEEAGSFEIRFQPAFQDVALHSITVERGGQRLELASRARFELLRREQSLDNGILDGVRTWHVSLPDVRVGDRVAYAYSVSGGNPAFAGRYHGDFAAGFGADLGLRTLAVVRPAGAFLASRVTADGYSHARDTAAGAVVERWTAEDLEGIDGEDEAPGWHDPFGEIQLSQARDWADVARWADTLYPKRFDDAAVAGRMRERLALSPADVPGSVLRALAFVQDEIRYTGIEIGHGSYAPAPAETTLERRYGDCKDKVVLLLALLGEAGIPAQPVLVHTVDRATVADRLPSAVAFDHVVARVRVGDDWLYVDPTRDHQAGPLAMRQPLGFGVGLPVAADSTGLVGLPDPAPAAPEVEVEQVFELAFDAGTGQGTADVRVLTHYRRGEAADIRARFAGSDGEAVGEDYLAYMRRYYDDIEQLAAPRIELLDGGEARVLERYRIGWAEAGEPGDGLPLVLFQILDWIPHRDAGPRRGPLSLRGPAWGTHRIVARFPDGWNIEDEHHRIESEGFVLERDVSVEDGTDLVIEATWRRTRDAVPGEAYEATRKDMLAARDLLEFGVGLRGANEEPAGAGALGWPLAALVLLAGVLALGWRGRDRHPGIGLLFRPRVHAPAIAGAATATVPLLLIVASGVAAALLEVDLRTIASAPSALGKAALTALVDLLRTFVGLGVALLGFRLFRRPVAYGALVRVAGWAGIPLLLGVLLALVAFAGDTSWLVVEDAPVPEGRLAGALVGFMLLAAGIAWTVVVTVGAFSAVARAGIVRTLLAMLAIPLLLAALVAAAIFLAKG